MGRKVEAFEFKARTGIDGSRPQWPSGEGGREGQSLEFIPAVFKISHVAPGSRNRPETIRGYRFVVFGLTMRGTSEVLVCVGYVDEMDILSRAAEMYRARGSSPARIYEQRRERKRIHVEICT